MPRRQDSETLSGMPLGEAISALRLTLLVALAVALPLISLACGSWGAARARAELTAETRGTLEAIRANLVSELEKHEAVPFLLAEANETAALLAHPTPEAVDRLNRRLAATAEAVHAAALYVIDGGGTTLAASNWDGDASFVGKNFAYRPYFQAALRGEVGRYFALGTSSRQPGYYIAYPVRAENRTPDADPPRPDRRILGTVVIKLGMERVEQAWAAGSERVIVADADGVIIITNTPDWRYRSLKPLEPAALARIAASQKFPDIVIEPLPVTGQPLDPVPAFDAGETIGIGGVGEAARGARYVVVSSPVPGTDWTLSLLLDTNTIQSQAMTAALLGGFATAIAILAGYQLLHRWMRAQERLADQRRAREDLERRVEARTADLARVNEELRSAQNELVQAAKLAALGQISASVAHEINQPLSAIRAYADNALVLLERGRTATARDNLAEIAELTRRLAEITRQLKGFARKAAGTLGPVNLAGAVDAALTLLGHRLRRERIQVRLEAPAAGDGPPPLVIAEDIRLQQVLVNLFTNAIDAMKGRPERLLGLEIERTDGAVVLRVRDSGPGIDETALPHLFEAFFTTKALGSGLGLGLSISAGIAHEFGGSLAAANHPEGGALFTLSLPPAEPS